MDDAGGGWLRLLLFEGEGFRLSEERRARLVASITLRAAAVDDLDLLLLVKTFDTLVTAVRSLALSSPGSGRANDLWPS